MQNLQESDEALYLTDFIKKDLEDKIVLLSGPRQVGKSTLSHSLFPETTEYINFDYSEDRNKILQLSWVREGKDLIVFDISKPLLHYTQQLKPLKSIQLLKATRNEKDIPIGGGFILLRKLSKWLSELEA